MSSFDDLMKRVQMLEEARGKTAGYAGQAPVFKDVPKQMKAAGLAASSRDAMLFILQVLSRLDIIDEVTHDQAKKGQHKERAEKLMAILKANEEAINAKEDEIVEFMNNNLDNYTSAAGTDRGRSEKYKETAKMISQEVQNIAAGKEADDALRDVTVKLAKGLEAAGEDPVELNFDDVDVFIDIPGDADGAQRNEISQAIVDQLNGAGYTADITNVGFNVEAPIGTFGDAEKAQDTLTGLVQSKFPDIPEAAVTVTLNTDTEDGEHTVERDSRGVEDGEGKYDDGDGVDERCDYVPCEDAEVACEDGESGCCCGGCPVCAANAMEQDGLDTTVDYNQVEDEEDTTSIKDFRGEDEEEDEDEEEVVAESARPTDDPLAGLYSNMGSSNVIIESTTVDENGITTPTSKYLAEKAEEAIEEVYTSMYLAEQKEQDSYKKSPKQETVSFKDRFQPKTHWQLEELRRYGL